MQVITKNITELIPAEYNPRRKLKPGDKEYEKLKKSIQEFGYVDPVIWNERTGHVVGGHQRLEVMQEMGAAEVMVSVVDLPEDKEKALNVALNKISGEWDQDKLVDLLHELGDMVELTGFDAEELDKLFKDNAEVKEDNFDAEAALAEITEPVTKRGDIWQLGRHRLMCGDSTMIDDVDRLMDGKKADMVFTDPPYGMSLDVKMSERQTVKGNWVSKPKKYDKVIGDNEDFSDDLITSIFINFDYCKEIFIFGSDYFAELLPNRKNGSWIVWDKRVGVESMKWSTSEFELCWSKQKHHRKIARITWSGILGTEQEHDHLSGRQHPTQKPTLLPVWFFEQWGKENDIVADIYGGSGSTLIACEQLNRICYMMELDEKYCDVIIKRWEELTGQKAELISG